MLNSNLHIKALSLLMIVSSISVSHAEKSDYDIAYLRLTDDFWQVWVTDKVGEKHQQVTKEAIDNTRVSWSKDRSELLCNRNDGSIVKININTGNKTTIKQTMQGALDAQWSPDNQSIIFSYAAETTPDSNDLWQMNTDGSNLKKVNNQPKLQMTPSWDKNGENIVYVSGTLKGYKIDLWKQDLKTGSKEQLTVTRELEFDPVFSPDNDIAYSSNRSGNYDIWVIKKDNPKPIQITSHTGSESQPTWSPDGKRIAYYAVKDNSRRIEIIDLASGKHHAITPANVASRYPAWFR